MARKSPLGKIKDAALDTIKDPIGSGQKAVGQAVGQAKGTVELGKAVAGQVTGQALTRATGTVGAVTNLVPGRKKSDSEPTETSDPITAKTAEKPAGTPDAPAEKATTKAKPAPAAKKTAKTQGDPVKPTKSTRSSEPVSAPVEDVATAVVKEAATKASPAKGSVAKAGTKKAKPAAKKAAAAPATPDNGIDAAADPDDVDVTPADIAASVAKKAPAKKAGTAAKKAPAKKATPSGRIAPKKAAPSATELAVGAGTETITPVGTTGADVGTNPDTTDTSLQQVGTEPLMDPSTAKSVASEAETLGRASDPDKG